MNNKQLKVGLAVSLALVVGLSTTIAMGYDNYATGRSVTNNCNELMKTEEVTENKSEYLRSCKKAVDLVMVSWTSEAAFSKTEELVKVIKENRKKIGD